MAINLPMYEQKTRAQAPTASGADFGAGIGQAVAQGGDVLAQIGERIQTRNETINRVRTMNQFEQQLQQDMVAFKEADDFTDPNSIGRFRESTRERREAALSSFSGRPGVRETFRSQLENMEGQYIKNVVGEQIKAGQIQIAQGVEKVTMTLGSMIVDDPSLYNLALQNAYEELNMLQPGMSEQAYSNSMLTLDRTAANAMVQSLAQRGDVDQLEEFLSNEQNRKLLDTRTHLSAQADISKVRYEREQRAAAAQGHITAVESVVGPLTQEQHDMVASMPDPSKMSVGQKMAFNQILLGRELTDKEQRQMMNIYSAETAMTKGNALATVSTQWGRFSSGSMNDEERIGYLTAWHQAGLLPGWAKNEATGVNEWINPVLPPELDRMRQVVMGQQPQASQHFPQSPTIQDGAIDAGNAVSPDYRNQPPPEVDYSIQSNVEQRKTEIQMLSDQLLRVTDGRGLYQMADNLVGPDSAFKAGVYNIAFFGSRMGVDPQVIEDRQFSIGVMDNIIRGLAVNRRFPVFEIKRMLDNYPVSPQTWSNPDAYRAYMRAIDRTAEIAIISREMSLQNEVSMDKRQEMMDQIEDLKTLRAIFNVTDEDRKQPLTLSNEEMRFMVQNETLKEGDSFIDSDGNTRVIRLSGRKGN